MTATAAIVTAIIAITVRAGVQGGFGGRVDIPSERFCSGKVSAESSARTTK